MDINQLIGNYGFPIVALIAVFAFLRDIFFRVWTYYTEVRWPAQSRVEQQRISNEVRQTESMIRIETLLANLVTNTNMIQAQSTETKQFISDMKDFFQKT